MTQEYQYAIDQIKNTDKLNHSWEKLESLNELERSFENCYNNGVFTVQQYTQLDNTLAEKQAETHSAIV